MASQNNGFKTVGSVLIGIFAAGLIAGGIYGTTRFMRRFACCPGIQTRTDEFET